MATKSELVQIAEEQRAQKRAIREEADENAALALPRSDGVMGLALMDDEEFDQHLVLLKKVSTRIQSAMRSYMIHDEDYGTIPGTPKPTLLKPGAEKLLQLFGLVARTETQLTAGDNVSAPAVTYDATTFIHRGSFAGPIMATGSGTANSWEKRYRRDNKVCPNCSEPKIIKSKYSSGWYCINCKSNFGKDDPAITDQSATTPIGDPGTAFDLANTLVKMASKRSLVDATLRATASSGLFAQDLAEEAPESTVAPSTPATPRAAQRPAVEPTVQYRDAPPARLPQEAESTEPPTTVNLLDEVVRVTGGEVIDITPSDTEGVERGGRTQNANEAQIEELRRLARDLHWGAKRILRHANDILETDMAIPEDAAEAKAELESWLASLSAAGIGRLIAEMRRRLDEDLPA